MQSNRAPRGIGVPPSFYNGYSTGWQYFLSSRTWKHPNPGYPVMLIVLAIGGGAGAGNSGTSSAGALSSGGGGGSGRVSLTEQTVTTDQEIVIGSAGPGGAAGAAANTGSAGGTTTFGSLVSLAGGSGGVGTNGTTGGAGGSGGFGGGGGVPDPQSASAPGAGGAGLDGIGGGPGAQAWNGSAYSTAALPGVSAGAALWVPFPNPTSQSGTSGSGTAPGGWPNGGSISASGSRATTPPNGGDATLLFPMLMGRGSGGNAVNSPGAGGNGRAGAVLVLVQPF